MSQNGYRVKRGRYRGRDIVIVEEERVKESFLMKHEEVQPLSLFAKSGSVNTLSSILGKIK